MFAFLLANNDILIELKNRMIMKNFTKVIAILTLIIGLGACAEDELLYNEETTEKSAMMISNQKKVKKNPLAPQVAKNEIVIKFTKKNPDVKYKDSIRKSLENRYHFKIIGDPETCNCDDDSIELWTINPQSGFGGIEDLVDRLSNTSGEGGVEGDHNFWLYVQDHRIDMGENVPISEWVVADNSPDAVTVAVLDTGVAYDFFEEPFLYNSSNPDNCDNEEISGWDFVNKDYDSMDDHGHGTAVAKIIKKTLDSQNVLHTILPVKVFDSQGKGSYFNVVCGLQYLAKKNIPLQINASFGFYALKDQHIFSNLLEDASDRLFLITSSGNKGIDTDDEDNQHYPSGYELKNMISVSGYQGSFFGLPSVTTQNVSGFSLDPLANFGRNNVDVAAKFSHELVFNRKAFSFNGTSYSSAVVTARAAAIYFDQFTRPESLKREILETAYNSYSFNGKIKNNKILISGYYRQDPILFPLN